MHIITSLGEYRIKQTGIAIAVLHDEVNPALIRGHHHVYYKDGRRHRIGGPAVLYADGRRAWYVNGDLHNEEGAAFTWPSGAMLFAIKDRWHRTTGPALITHSGVCHWFVNGKRMTKEAFDDKYS